ncbi:MAG: ABC transporter permease [Caldilineales bacterium]|nr:ABC transporter permease [Caldilineales bacterium]
MSGNSLQNRTWMQLNLGTLSTPLAFLGVFFIFWLFSPEHRFTDPRNLAAMAKLAPDLGVVALGVGILMIAGEFDLSVAAILPFSSYIFAQLLIFGLNPFLAFLIVIPFGALLGLLNGVLVVRTGLPSFIITLATLMFWRGVLYVVSGLMPISILRWIPKDSSFAQLLTGQIGPIPMQFIWYLTIAIVLGVILHLSKFGNWIYSTGANVDAAKAMGVRVNMTKIVCFMILGSLCAFAAIMQATRLGSFAATQGNGFELRAIAAVVVGGVSLRGGVGTMLGIALGVFIIQIIDNGLILMQVPVFGINTFIGIAVILFVIINNLTNRGYAAE